MPFQLKFEPNIGFMFQEYEFKRRFSESLKLGFGNVEFHQLSNIAEVIDIIGETGQNITMINTPESHSNSGFAAVPGQENAFRKNLDEAITIAKELNIKKIHILAGITKNIDFQTAKSTYIGNLRYAADILNKNNILGLIEPLCSKTKENYFLSSFELAAEIIEEIASDHLKLMLDVYQLQMISGDAMSLMDTYFPYTGHIQIAQAPNRTVPTDPGLINFHAIFRFLSEKKYDDFIGLEYFSTHSTEKSLQFLSPTGLFSVEMKKFPEENIV